MAGAPAGSGGRGRGRGSSSVAPIKDEEGNLIHPTSTQPQKFPVRGEVELATTLFAG